MKHIPLHRTLVVALALAVSLVASSFAQSSGSYSTGGSQNFSLPGFSSMGGGGDSVTLFEADFNAGLGFDLGCGGIGLFDFMQASFDLGNIVEEFKSSLSTSLSKALVTFAMSSPQIASLFDTLNAFGNARFDMFQQSCDISEIREEVRNQVQDTCVQRKVAGGSSQAAAQAACANTVDPAIANEITQQFAKTVRQSENIGELLRGPMCGGGSSYTPGQEGCFIMGMLPQFRLCLRSSIGESCPTDGYGAREAPISIAGMADATTAATQAYMAPVDVFNTSPAVMSIPDAVANQAALATQARLAKGDKPQGLTTPKPLEEKTQKLIDEFQAQLACLPDSDAFIVPLLYSEELAKLGVSVPAINTSVDLTAIQNALGAQFQGALVDSFEKDIEGIQEVLRVGVNCIMNRNGINDPVLGRNIARADTGTAASFKQGLSQEVGHQLAMEIGTFLKKMIRNGMVQLSVDKVTGPALAQAQEQTALGIDPADQKLNQVSMSEVITEPAKQAAGAMIEKIDAMMQDEQRRYEANKKQIENNRLLRSMTNGTYLDARAKLRSGTRN